MMRVAQASVLSSEELFGVVANPDFLDSLNLGLMIFDRDGSFTGCNQATVDLCGAALLSDVNHAGADARGRGSRRGSQLPWEEPLANALRTGAPCAGVIVSLDEPDIERRWISVSSWPMMSEGSVRGVVVTIEDVTDRWRRTRLLALHKDVMTSIVAANDELTTLQALCDAITSELTYDSAWIGVESLEREFAIDAVCSSGRVDMMNAGAISWSDEVESGQGFVGTALRLERTEVENRLLESERDRPWRAVNERSGFNSGMALPIRVFGRRGVLNILDAHPDAFDPTVVQEIESSVHEIQFGISHLEAVNQLNDSLVGTLNALSSMTEIRDPYTAGHQNQVARLSMAIATRMGLASPLVTLIGQGAEVHDIGKIAIPAEILTRPGRLSPTEFELIKTHSSVGYDILSAAHLPWPIPEVAHQHHERLDASGYPSGLRGEEICLPARIVAVADVVEAMSHRRPYRGALGVEQALAEIQKGSGTLYDHDVVVTCLQLFDEGYDLDALSDDEARRRGVDPMMATLGVDG
ncbi:MAG: HD domain-containing protein [Acidobacteriota bacterium]|nr:HD domain-containing protein [Acidobacteriota bacterium]